MCFDTIGFYSIETNARSSFQALVRMILWHTTEQRSVDAQKLFNPESNCLTDIPTSTQDHAHGIDFRVSPNPANGQFWVELGDPSPKQITLMNCLGQPIKICQTTRSKQLIPNGSLAPGAYLVELKIGPKCGMRRIVVR